MGLGHWRADLLAGRKRRIRGAAMAENIGKGEAMSEQGIAGKVFIGEGFPMEVHTGADPRTKTAEANQHYTPRTLLKPLDSVEDLRAFVQAIVRETLEEDARAIRERKEFQPVKQAGTCCACLQSGDDMAWVGHRLSHRDEECRRIAAEMPPVREHRG